MSVQKLYRHAVARYGRMVLFANDTGALTSSLMRYGEWAENEIAFMRALAGKGSTVLDVGAYIGTHTLAFSRRVGQGGRVLAFEPQPQSFRVLECNVAFNRLSNVQLHQAAVGDVSGEASIRLIDPAAKSSFGSASLAKTPIGRTAPEGRDARVQLLTIDDLGLDRCDLIKIDVEGMERLVLQGARQTIESHRPWVYAECNAVHTGLETCSVLRSLGYGVRLHLVEAFHAANFRNEAENIFADAREVALVGIPPGRAATVDNKDVRPGEMLLRIESADDLVLGMLNKPQYVGEVLQASAASASGGGAWIRATAERRGGPYLQLRQTQQALDSAQALAIERAQELDRQSVQFRQTQEALDSVQALAIERAQELDRQSVQLRQTQVALHSVQALAIERAQELDRQSVQLWQTQVALDSAQALAIERAQELDRQSVQLRHTQQALDSTKALAIERCLEVEALRTEVEATLRQAGEERTLYRQELEEYRQAIHASAVAAQEVLDIAQAEAARLASSLARAETDLQREREQLVALLRSHSWQITKPLRAVSRALRQH